MVGEFETWGGLWKWVWSSCKNWVRETFEKAVHGARSSVAMFLMFGFLVYLNLYTSHKVDYITVILAVLAVSPWLLPLIAKYVLKLKIGPISAELSEAYRDASEVDRLTQNKDRFIPKIQPEGAPEADYYPPAFESLPEAARKILATLWKNQEEMYPNETKAKRFGFRVEQATPEYQAYFYGLIPLIREGLVVVDARGFCFLSEQGLAYCRQFRAQIERETNLYGGFGHDYGAGDIGRD